MSIMVRFAIAISLFLTASNSALAACSITIGPTTSGAVGIMSSTAYPHVCLQAGNYSIGSATLNLPAGKILEGLGANRAAVTLNSTADRAISVSDNVTLHNFTLSGPGGNLATFGVLVYYKSNVLIWGLAVKNFLINVGLNGASGTTIADVQLLLNGNLSDGIASPNLWISSSTDIEVNYGMATGRGNGPGGDGEISCYDSTSVDINGMSVIDSGASGLFFVNCDSSSITNINSIDRANEWGIDVHGSDNMHIVGNTVRWSNFGAIVFEEAQTIGGTPPVNGIGGVIRNNAFVSNEQMSGPYCENINIDWNTSHVAMSGNTTNRGSLVCQWDVTP